MNEGAPIRPLLTGYLLGKHVELQLRGGRTERGVVVRLKFAGERSVTLTEERASDYNEALGVWIPRRPRTEWTQPYDKIESIMVIDRIETKIVLPEEKFV